MRKYLPCLLLVSAMAVGTSTAAADPTAGPPICSSAGMPLSGTVGSLTIKGNAYVPAGSTLTVKGNLTLAPGSCFDAFTIATVNITGSVNVGKNAILGLGCSPGAIGPEPPCGMTTTNDVVGNGISAREAMTMYLTAVTVHGSVTSIGGGPGPTFSPYINFPIKENTITRNLDVQGWHGAWFGVIRNTIYGFLSCFGNWPAPQIGDSGGSPNTVFGKKLGQCTAV